jgi:predicted permease
MPDWKPEILRRLAPLNLALTREAEIADELSQHVEDRYQELLSRGVTFEAAQRAALEELKDEDRLARDLRPVERQLYREPIAPGSEEPNFVEGILQDVRYAVRMLRKSPGFTAVAILTLALGIGATTAIFSVVDATLLHPLPYPRSEQLVRLMDNLPGAGTQDVGMSVPEWQDLQRSGVFEYVSPDFFANSNLTGSNQPTRTRFLGVAPNYFALLRVKPQLGRSFNAEDHSPGFLTEAVISDALWKQAFGSDPNILDRSIRIDNDLYRVIGVMPPGFHDPGRTSEERNIEIWGGTGFSAAPFPNPPLRNVRFLPGAIARLKTGLTIAAAQSRVDALVATLQKQFPDAYPQKSAWTVRLVPLKESVVGNVRQSLILLLGAVALVLLIGCVNIANLLLARSSARGREFAIRQSLGAARKRLIRQLLTESLLLSLLGGAAGLAVLFYVKGFLLQMIPETLPRLSEVSINWTVLFIALVASLIAGAAFGLAPALQTARLDLTHMLKLEGRGATGSGQQSRTRRLLVVTEFAFSLVLMIAASLLLRSFWDLATVHLGFVPQGVMMVRIWLPVPNDPRTDIYGTPAQESPFLRELLRRGRTLPGVEEIALGNSSAIPLNHAPLRFPLILEGSDAQSDRPLLVEGSFVTPGYFDVLGIPLLSGRAFTELDNENAPLVVLVNQSFTRTYWPNEGAVGKRLKLGAAASPWVTVIGVVADTRTESLAEESTPQVYAPLYKGRSKDLAIFLRGQIDPAAIPRQLREQVQAVNPELPVFGAETLNEVLSVSLSERRFSMEVVGLFALTALLLAGIGIYGVISYIVSERTHEIGIRLTLGAQKANIMQMVLRQGLGLATAGAAIGLIGALVVSHLMVGLLYGVSPADPLTFVSVTIVLTVVALVACYIPARRAMRVDPMVALRYE